MMASSPSNRHSNRALIIFSHYLIIMIFCTGVSVKCQALQAQLLARRASLRLYNGSAPRQRWKSRSTTTASSEPMNDEGGSSVPLEWENFDFGESPKWDSRFEASDPLDSIRSPEQLEELVATESVEDMATAEEINRQSSVLKKLSPEWVASATSILSPYIQSSRLDRINDILSQRTQHCRFLFENPVNPSNVWACLRTIDSFGVQYVDLVIQSGKYKGKAAISQKRGMRTAMGSAQWLTLRNHISTTQAIESLKQEGYRILASDLNPNSKDIRTIDWTTDDRPVCIIMGNESEGISEEMRASADETFTLPMSGFAESFNLSVATAVTLAHLSACSTETGRGPLRPGDLNDHEVNCLRMKGILNSLSQKKLGKALLRKKGLEIPSEMDLL